MRSPTAAPLCSFLFAGNWNQLSSAAFLQSVPLSTSPPLSFHLASFPPSIPLFLSLSLFPSMPWVGGRWWRWEVRARVCAGNHGNPVLIGQWPGRMIVSCCQWGLGRPQMGPSDTRRREALRQIYSLRFQFRASESISGAVETLAGSGWVFLLLRCDLLAGQHRSSCWLWDDPCD